MIIPVEKSLWSSLRDRASLMLRLARCTDIEVHRYISVLREDRFSTAYLDTPQSCQAEDPCEVESNNSPPSEAVESNSVNDKYFADHVAEIGREISGRICRSLQDAREKTEDAVMAVCDQVTQLVEIARQGNEEAQSTLLAIVGSGTDNKNVANGISIAEVVHTQAESVNGFVTDTREFFNQQIATGDAAAMSCEEMQSCIAQVVKLVFSSEILAYNIQIESARLGDSGRAFSVLGDEMVRFSSQVREANIAIQSSLKLVTETMRQSQMQSRAMDTRLDTFTEQLRQKMDDVQLRTSKLTDSLHLTLERITNRNRKVIACSQEALSELQFQDPLAQSLRRTERDVHRLGSLIENGTCDSRAFSEFNARTGNDCDHDREPGFVDLF